MLSHFPFDPIFIKFTEIYVGDYCYMYLLGGDYY
jgi:hypothetical protein